MADLCRQAKIKRSRHPSSSDESDNGSNSTCWSQHSKSQHRRGKGKKPSEVFRTDLITAMKVHDSYQLNPEEYYILADQWRQEWEKGVQVPVSPQSIPQPVVREVAEKGKEVMFVKPKKFIRTSGAEVLGYVDIQTLAEGVCRYDLNGEDVSWLQIINKEFADMALPMLDEVTMERVMEEFENRCHDNMTHAMETEEGLGIEYDEDVVCDVCQSPDGEDNNEMVFCDKCNICVHQACYGIQKVPKGSWLCRICAIGILPKCQLCPKKGGAMKPTRSGTKWVHVSCALWIPEVSIGNPEKMEPITNVSQIPSNRWALICCLCKEKMGACIQCSAKNCRTAFHVTCGLSASLEMNTILTEDDEVKFKSYCPKHSGLEGEDLRDRDSGGEEEKDAGRDKKGKRRGRVRVDEHASPPCSAVPHLANRLPGEDNGMSCRQQEEKRVNLRKLKVQAMEEGFYEFVNVKDVANHLKLLPHTVDFLFQYWKLKRKANANQPLLTPKKDEEESLARREHEVLLRRLQLFTHLRQDLERVRNLTYMVTRREKMKRSLCRVQEQIFQHQVRLLDCERLTGDPSVKDLENLFLVNVLSPRDSQACSDWTQSALKVKSGSVPQEKRRSRERRSLPDFTSAPSRDTVLEQKREQRGSKETEPADVLRDDKTLIPERAQEPVCVGLYEPEGRQEATPFKPNKPEVKKGLRNDIPWSKDEEDTAPVKQKTENGHEQEERRRKRRSEGNEVISTQVKTQLGTKHLEKTVSIRLVDIRNSERDRIFRDEAANRRGAASQVGSAKLGKTNPAPDAAPRAHIWLRKSHSASASGPHPSGRSWGKFKIPRRGERPPPREQDSSEPRKPLLRPLTNTHQPSQPRMRLRSGLENDGYDADAKPGDGGVERCLKRCHSHPLRSDSALSRRYGSDIIRRGVLAS